MNCLQNSEEYNHELKYIITLDGGTTNTRAYLWKQDGSFVSSKYKLGNSLGFIPFKLNEELSYGQKGS